MSLLVGCIGFYTNGPSDLSGAGNNLTKQGSPSTATGPDGVAGSCILSTTSNSNYFTGNFFPTTYPFAISSWIFCQNNWNSVGASMLPIFSGTESGILLQYTAGSVETDAITCRIRPIARGTWMHVVQSVDGSGNESIYIQNVLLAGPTPITVSPPPYDRAFQMARAVSSLAFRQAFTGFWSRALLASEITQLFNGGFGLNPFGTPPNPLIMSVVASGPASAIAIIMAPAGAISSLYVGPAAFGQLTQVLVGTVTGSGQIDATGLPPGPSIFTVDMNYQGVLASASYLLSLPGSPTSKRRPLATYQGYLGGA